MPNPVVHFEIGCKDLEKTQSFYSGVFEGWKFEKSQHHLKIRTGEEVGGHLTSLGYEPHHYTIFYVQVDDLQKTLDKAVKHGGKTLIPAMQIPGGDEFFAWMQDPEGNVIGLFSETKSQG